MSPRTLAALGFVTLLSLSTAAAEPADPAPLLRIGGGDKTTGACRIAYAPDGKTIACAGSGPVRLYDAASGKLLRSLKVDARCLAFAPDGKTLAAGEGPSVHVFNVATGEEALQFKAHPNGVLAVVFSPDGKILATAGDDDHVVLWDAAGKERSRLELHETSASVLAFSPNGQYLTAGGDAGALTVWRMEDDFQDERRRLVGRDGRVGCTAFLPDGNAFLWTQGRTIRVSEVETWVEIARYDGGDMDAACCALSPDGKTLATGGGHSVHFWDLETGEELLAFHDDKAEAVAVAFAPDGKTLASAAADGTVLVWDLKGLARGRLEALWHELGGSNAADAIHAVRVMKAAPAESVAFLRERLRPPPPPDPRIPKLIADLDDDDFNVRQKATAELAKLGKAVEADLKKAHDDRPSPEGAGG